MNVDATLTLDSAGGVLAIPSAALNRGNTVLVTADSPSAANGTLMEGIGGDSEQYYSVPVEVGVSDDSYIEIISGLQEGDTVAYIPNHLLGQLRDGQHDDDTWRRHGQRYHQRRARRRYGRRAWRVLI